MSCKVELQCRVSITTSDLTSTLEDEQVGSNKCSNLQDTYEHAFKSLADVHTKLFVHTSIVVP